MATKISQSVKEREKGPKKAIKNGKEAFAKKASELMAITRRRHGQQQ